MSPEGDILNPEGFALPHLWDYLPPEGVVLLPMGIEERHMDSTGLWWPRTAIKNIEICRNYFCYFFFNFDLLLIFLFKIKVSEM